MAPICVRFSSKIVLNFAKYSFVSRSTSTQATKCKPSAQNRQKAESTKFENRQNLRKKLPPTTETVVDVPKALEQLFDRCILSGTFPGPLRYELRTLKDVTPCVYAGFDPTADSLHVGNLLVIMALINLYASGFQVIAVIGEATARLGDPSGRTSDRPMLGEREARENSQKLAEQIERIFGHFEEFFCKEKAQRSLLKPLKMLNNASFYENMSAVDFLGSVGRNFRVGKMLRQHAVRTRLETSGSLAFSEFTYQILQSYDWLRLFELYDCRFQLGGTDQLGHLESGHDFVKKMCDKTDVYGLMLPLITTETGSKYGKSAGNAVWLDGLKTSPYEFYQFFLRTPDLEVQRNLQFFTFFSLKEVDRIFENHMKRPHDWEAQRKLADQVTLLVHGKEGLASALRCSEALFSNEVDSLSKLSPDELNSVFRDVPSFDLDFDQSISMIDLVLRTQCFKNAQDAERIIRNGGFYVNNVRLTEPEAIVVPGAHILADSDITVLRTGKRHYTIVKWKFRDSE